MPYYWRAEDVPELAEVPPVDREMWWRIVRNQSRSGFLGRFSGWLDPLPWIVVFLAFSGTAHRQDLFVAIACMATAFAVVFVLDVCLDQPRRCRWLREHMREYQSGRPWLQPSSTVMPPRGGSEITARYWRLNDIPELKNHPWKRRLMLWSDAVSRSTTAQIVLGTNLTVFMAGTVAGGACWVLFPAISPLWAALPVIACASFVADRWFRWPAACRWLREHELEHHVPA